MNILLKLLKNDFLHLKEYIISIINISIVLPLFLYLFFSIPLSVVFLDVKPIYLIWSGTGIYVVSSLYIIYFLLNKILLTKLNSEFIFTTPININDIIFSSYLLSILLGVIQSIISIVTINSLNYDFMSFFDIILFVLIMIPSFIIIANFSFIISILKRKRLITLDFTNIFFFIIVSFGLGAFIPIHYFPEKFSSFISYMPIGSSIINVQKINSAESIYFSSLALSIIYAICTSLITIFVLENAINKRAS